MGEKGKRRKGEKGFLALSAVGLFIIVILAEAGIQDENKEEIIMKTGFPPSRE